MASNETGQNATDGQSQTTETTKKQKICGNLSIVKEPNTWIYFAVYCMLFAMDGFTLGFPGAVYLELQQNLNASTFTLSWIYSTLAIGYMTASIGSGYIADHMKEIHRVHAPIIFMSSMCTLFVPYCTNVAAMFVIFAVIGIGLGAIETNETLFTFRLFPMSDSKMITWAMIVVVVFGALTPLLVEASIDYFDSMEYPFIVFGIIGIVHSILVLFLKTPQHDELRSIKKSISKTSIESNSPKSNSPSAESPKSFSDFRAEKLDELVKTASTRLKETKRYNTLQIVTVVLLMLIMMVEGSVIRGYLSFIAPYCVDYLEIHESWSRYYIVCIYASYAGYRIMKCIVFPNFSSIVQVSVSSVLRLVFAVGFVFYGNDVVSLFVVYILIGLSGAPIVPSLLTWGESITPTTGLISCSWWIFYGIGDAAMSLTLGSLMDVHGEQIMPVAVAVSLSFGLIINICAVVTSNSLKEAQTKVFAEAVIKMGDVPTCDSECETNRQSAKV